MAGRHASQHPKRLQVPFQERLLGLGAIHAMDRTPTMGKPQREQGALAARKIHPHFSEVALGFLARQMHLRHHPLQMPRTGSARRSGGDASPRNPAPSNTTRRSRTHRPAAGESGRSCDAACAARPDPPANIASIQPVAGSNTDRRRVNSRIDTSGSNRRSRRARSNNNSRETCTRRPDTTMTTAHTPLPRQPEQPDHYSKSGLSPRHHRVGPIQTVRRWTPFRPSKWTPTQPSKSFQTVPMPCSRSGYRAGAGRRRR